MIFVYSFVEGRQNTTERVGKRRAEVSVINCTYVSHYLPVALLCLPAGTVQPPPMPKVSEAKSPFRDV